MDVAPIQEAKYPADSVAYTGTAGTTDAVWPAGPKGVWVWGTTAMHVRVGAVGATTATVADFPLPANVPVALLVPDTAGLAFVVSAIQVALGGTLYAKPLGGS